jgi:hypothetical protein
MAVNAERRSAA